MECYADVPISPVASLVRLSELHSNCRVLPLDSHFTRYRRHDSQLIQPLAPW